MFKTNIITVIFALILLNTVPAFPQSDLSSEIRDPELDQEMAWLKAETFVITASKVRENIKKAPASISVITDRQIRQMGARHLADVLRTIPGIQTYYHYLGMHLISVRRGTAGGGGSNKVLILLNGHPLNSTLWGGATWVNDTFIVDNIKRIEVIRGPGSALYGANAFHGVINIITKEANDIDGLKLTARGGSWDTQQYNLLYGNAFNDLEIAFNFNYFKTHGYRAFINEDYQTQIDWIWTNIIGFPSDASLAPGRTKGDDEKYDAQFSLKYKGFKFDGRYVDRKRDLPASYGVSLTDKSISDQIDYYLDLSYENTFWEVLDLNAKVYSNLEDSYMEGYVFPPGYVTQTPTGPQIITEGMIFESYFKTYRNGIEIQTICKIGDTNTVVAGATYEEMKQYDTKRSGNYLPTPDPKVVIPLPSVREWPDAFTEDTEKVNFKAVFLEDIWDITDNLRLTTGVRYDRYSNFGGEASPRVGLTWEFKDGFDLKLLYGHAFRAPSFQELYFKSGGNPDLDPETINTYEASLGAEFTSSLSARITVYYETVKDMIRQDEPPATAMNAGNYRSHGFEVEMKYDFGRGTYIAGNYNYGSTPIAEDFRSWFTPRHMGNIMANIRLSRYLNFYTNCHFEDGFQRDLGDTRDEVSGYATVDATFIARKILKGYEGLELRASVYNLLDKEYVSPQDDRLPNDLPMPGRNYILELKYRF